MDRATYYTLGPATRTRSLLSLENLGTLIIYSDIFSLWDLHVREDFLSRN